MSGAIIAHRFIYSYARAITKRQSWRGVNDGDLANVHANCKKKGFGSIPLAKYIISYTQDGLMNLSYIVDEIAKTAS